MTEKGTFRISTAAAAYVRGDASKQEKLKAARGEVPLCANDLGVLLFVLCLDADPEIKAAAVKSLREMPDDILSVIAGAPGTHAKVLDLLARIHFGNGALVEQLLSHPAIEDRTVEFLLSKGIHLSTGAAAALPTEGGDGMPEGAGPVKEAEGAEEAAEEEEEFLSRFKIYQQLGVADKIKLALTGDKAWRSILIKDSIKVVARTVVKNPRITESEILTIANSKVQSEDILRIVCMNKDWTRNYQIRKALVENSKTPLQFALRFITSLTEKDLATLAKNKNVLSVIATNARRLLLNKKKHS